MSATEVNTNGTPPPVTMIWLAGFTSQVKTHRMANCVEFEVKRGNSIVRLSDLQSALTPKGNPSVRDVRLTKDGVRTTYAGRNEVLVLALILDGTRIETVHARAT